MQTAGGGVQALLTLLLTFTGEVGVGVLAKHTVRTLRRRE